MTIDHSRERLRNQMREQRERCTPVERIAAASGVADVLEQLPEFLVDQHIAGYWAIGGELPLHFAVTRARARGQHFYLPIVSKGSSLRFAPLLPNADIQPNRYGIPEPAHTDADLLAPMQLDLVLMPLVAFDRRGHRLGTGGGYYDRSFAFLREAPRPARPLLVGIGYSFQEVVELPIQHWDVRLDFVATEKELIDCNDLPARASIPPNR
jgi:5-formyltetrahydrofolate cyclo-ligase